MQYLYIFNLFLNIISIGIKKRKKIIVLFSFIFFIILMGGSTSDPDWIGYYAHYVTSASNLLSIEFGYQLVQKFFYTLGFQYQMFRLILAIMAFAFMYYLLVKFLKTKSWSLFLSTYSLFLLFYDSIQLRNFIGFLFVMLGSFFLFQRKSSIIKFIICILIGTSFHISMIVYLVFLLPRLKQNTIILFLILLLSFSFSSLLILNGMKVPYINEILLRIDSEKYLTYFKQGTTLGAMYPIFLQIINYIYIYIVNIFFKKTDEKENFFQNENLIQKINLVSFCFIPFFMINLNFYRFIRNIVFLNLVYGQNKYNYLKNKNQKLIFIIITFIYILVWCIYGFWVNNEFNVVVENLFKGNYWIK